MNRYKYKIFFTLCILSLSFLPISYAQNSGNKFVIAPDYPINVFAIDRIAQQVYFNYYGGWNLKVDLKSGKIDSTGIAGVIITL